MAGSLARMSLLLCLGLLGAAAHAEPAADRSPPSLRERLASGQATPLDALTPYGKRRLLRSIRWSEDGRVTAFNTSIPARELDVPGLSALLAFLGNEELLPILQRQLQGPSLRLPEPSPDVEQKLIALEQAADAEIEARTRAAVNATPATSAALLARYTRLFDASLAPAALRQQPLGDLLPLFEAAALINFYHPGSALPDLLRVHGELGARGISTERWIDERVLQALLAARRFERARTFAAGKAWLAQRSIPKVVDPLDAGFSGRSLYRYDGAGNTLTREAAPAPGGIQVVMVVADGCQPSARALAALREDGELQARLRQANLLLVTDPGSSIPLHFIAAWNAANPRLPMRATHSLEEWHGVNPAGVPAFFVLKDGKPVDQLRGGWPPEGNRAALLEMLDAAAR